MILLFNNYRCHGYDNITPYTYFANCLVPTSDPTFNANCVNTQFFVNEPAYCGQFFNSYIGGALEFPVIENQNWLTLPPILGNGPTLRHVDLYLLDSMHATYDIGEFDENIFQQMCGRSFASKWFLKINPNRRRLKNTPSKRDSDYFKFEMNAFNKIFNGKNGQKRSKKEKFKAWAQATCEHQMEIHNKTCQYPTYWYNCDDLSDAEITLDEMINRINGSECMIQTRKKFYHWALAGNSVNILYTYILNK